MSQATDRTEESNPYAPPGAAVAAALPPRPVSVVVLQVVIVLCAAFYLLGFVSGIYVSMRPGTHLVAPAMYAAALLLRTIPLAFMAITFWALAKRRPLGRWLGLLSILALLALVVYQSLYPPQGPTLFPRMEISSSPGEQAGAVFAQLLVYALIAWWFFSFGFSRKARAFFART